MKCSIHGQVGKDGIGKYIYQNVIVPVLFDAYLVITIGDIKGEPNNSFC